MLCQVKTGQDTEIDTLEFSKQTDDLWAVHEKEPGVKPLVQRAETEDTKLVPRLELGTNTFTLP